MTSTALLRSEWTKFRTVRGWVAGMLVAALLIVFVSVLAGVSSAGHHGEALPPVPLGPGGEAVTDSFYFVHQPLAGNGVLTASVTSLKDTTPGVQDPGLGGLGATAQAGLFVASPPYVQGGGTAPSVATAVFGDISLRGQLPGNGWIGEQLGPDSPSFSGYPQPASGAFTKSAGSVTVTGAGDIAPAVREALVGASVIGDLLTGTFAALIAVIVVGTRFITAEYRQGLIRTTLAASPRRGRVLIVKAVVVALVSFAAGLVGAVLALAVGTVLRRSAGAVTAVTASIVVPYILVATPLMPASAADWLTRVTPLAAFSVQQSLVQYPQVNSLYIPANGYYPLAPWAGNAVLCGYAVLALAVAAILLRRRDA